MENTTRSKTAAPRVLVIGAYGLIGFGITKQLQADGYHVTGLGRNERTAAGVIPEISWLLHDVSTLTVAELWDPILRDVSHVVNCSGALQDGPEDDIEAVHHHAVAALANACQHNDVKLIQISAVGATLDAKLTFLSSKARGDAAIKASGVNYHIFRPGLVLAHSAYGGTAMIRMLAAIPLLQPLAVPDTQIQTVALADVAAAVSAAVSGDLPSGFEGDLVEATPHTLRDVVASHRRWLGFAAARTDIVLWPGLVTVACKVADALSFLGWRSPLRSTAIEALSDGISGIPQDLTRYGVPPIKTLSETLARMPARAEDRLFARMLLLMPLMIMTLSVYWLASGIISIARINEAARTLENVGWSYGLAAISVAFWAIVDIGIGVALLVRKYAPIACWAAIGVSTFYLAASTIFVPSLWADPLGPLVKVLPGMMLVLVTRISLENR